MIEITVAEAYSRRPMDHVILFYQDVVVTGIEQSGNSFLLHNPRFPNGIPVRPDCPLRQFAKDDPRRLYSHYA